MILELCCQLNLHLWATFMMFWLSIWVCLGVGKIRLFAAFVSIVHELARVKRQKKVLSHNVDVSLSSGWKTTRKREKQNERLSRCLNNSVKIMFFIFHSLRFRLLLPLSKPERERVFNIKTCTRSALAHFNSRQKLSKWNVLEAVAHTQCGKFSFLSMEGSFHCAKLFVSFPASLTLLTL